MRACSNTIMCCLLPPHDLSFVSQIRQDLSPHRAQDHGASDTPVAPSSPLISAALMHASRIGLNNIEARANPRSSMHFTLLLPLPSSARLRLRSRADSARLARRPVAANNSVNFIQNACDTSLAPAFTVQDGHYRHHYQGCRVAPR